MSASRRRHSRPRGVTLVELLVAMAIVAILASTVLFAMIGARESARKAKTRSMVATLNSLLMERWESYATRRVPVSSGASPAAAAGNRLNGLRELLRMEIPDRWSDVATVPVGGTGVQRTALSQAYKRRYDLLLTKTNVNTGATNTASDLRKEQGAECLYLVITLATGDGEAREHFSESDIGDTDGDGALEFLDGWGKPIRFLRWAPGFISEKQPLFNGVRDPDVDHDPFDPRKIDMPAAGGTPRGYRLVPLVYSAGPDGSYDIDSTGSYAQKIDPYAMPPSPASLLGTRGDTAEDANSADDSLDNIHSHLIGQR